MNKRSWRIAAFAVVFAAAVPAGAMAAEKIIGVLSEDSRILSYTPCAAEDAAECISYTIDCVGADGSPGNLGIYIFGNEQSGPKVRVLAKTLIDKPYDEAKVRFSLAGGQNVDLVVASITVSQDEMNGDWDLNLESYEQTTLFDALTKVSAAKVTLDVAGHQMTISDGKKLAGDLLKFKTACSN